MSRTQTALDATTAFSLLSADRRWAVAAAVDEANGAVSTAALSTMLAAREQQVPPQRVDGGTRESIQRDLEEVHLPRLDSNGVVVRDGAEYTPGENLAGLLEVADAALEHLDSPFRQN